MKVLPDSAADLIARLLKRRGVTRVFALCGGHIMPIWMRLDAEGIRIIDVRDERAAVHMAQAHAELTGELGVALVTAGPGMTNAITGIANAHVSRAPILVMSGGNPRPQENRGGLQDMDHTQLVRSITRYARTVREPSLVLQELDEAISRAYGEGGEPGPSYIDFPTDTLRGIVPKALQLDEHLDAKPRAVTLPDPAASRAGRRPAVVGAARAGDLRPRRPRRRSRTGLAARSARRRLSRHRREPRPRAGQSSVRRRRDARRRDERRRRDSDRRPSPRLPARLRLARRVRQGQIRAHQRCACEMRDNRRGAVEILASPAETLRAMVEHAGNRVSEVDRQWAAKLRSGHEERAKKLQQSMAAAPNGYDGKLHPNKVLSALQKAIGNDSVVITDGGDFLAFARVGLNAPLMLDPGPFGCIGIGVPYGIAASLAFPDKPVVVATGDGAFGFNAIEVDTAVRHKAPVLIVVANNGAWQIEVHDQTVTHGKVVGTRLQVADYAGMARAFGMHAERVETEEQLGPAIERALANRPALLDMVVTPEAISSDGKTGLAWVPDLQPLAAWDEAERKWRAS